MRWEWLPDYLPALAEGLLITLEVLVVSVVAGFALAIPLALAQVKGGYLARKLAGAYCSYIRGTPLLMQLYLLYYGIGSLFPLIPGARENLMWLIRLDAIYYVILAFTLSFAGYEAEIMRGAFLSVPGGELEAAEAMGMSPGLVLRRIWFPSAFLKVLPTLTGEVIGQLKSTPLAFTVPVQDLMGVAHKVMQDTYRIYEPLLFVALVYLALTYVIVQAFGRLERLVPQRRSV
ncbi:MAG: ABC transporter permease subunit [Alphaproteobacteria bacterium]|nr:ABC transporter permease subunit [Alphaproteobacteria bacterium]